MEGGEGVMAVVRGLPDGLAVVLMERRREDLGARRRLVARRSPRQLKSCYELDVPTRLMKEVETSTLTGNISVNADATAQVCDGHYASTYQLAHCSVLPTSPPVDLPEFPLQRSEPCRTQGNFEVGGHGGECRSRSPSPNSFDVFRGMSPDRGSHSRPDREAGAFVNSLRKYPAAPDRPPTADLLQRLIKQAQDKYIAKTEPARTMRNVREKTSPVSVHREEASKTQQTYTRGRRDESPTRIVNAARRARRSGFTSPAPGCSREVRARDTFDYLNTDIPRPAPGTACGDRQAIRDSIRSSLRQVFGSAQGPVTVLPVCPKILSRLEKHRREHHICDEPRPRLDEACGSLGSLPWGSTCGPPEASTSCPAESQLTCCKCEQPYPCTCKPSPKCSCRESRASEDEIQERRRLEEIVCSWLDDLPVSAKEKPQDKFIRDALIKKLIDTLATIKDNEFDTKGREEIEQCIDKMPMWYPSDKREREKFRNDLVDSLFDRIRGFRKRDRFKDVIEKWLDTIDLIEDLDKGNVVDNFSKELKDIALNRPSNDGIYRDKLKCKIFDMVQDLPIKATVDKDDLVNLKSEQLADQLVRLPKNAVKPDSYFELESEEAKKFKQMQAVAKKIADREFGGIILSALNEIDGLRDLSEEEKEVAIKELISNLPNLLSDDEEYVAKEMYDQIHNWLVKLAADNGVNIDNKTKGSFIDGLVDKLEDSLMTHLDLGESMTGFLSDLPKPEKKPDQYSYGKGGPSDVRQLSSVPYPTQAHIKNESNISDLQYPNKRRSITPDQSYLGNEGSPTGPRSSSGKKSQSPQRYPSVKRRLSDQKYIDDDSSPTSQRSVSGKRSPILQRNPPGKHRQSNQSYLEDDGSPTSQRSSSEKKSPSPQRYPSDKRRLSDQSYLNDDGSPTNQRSVSGKRSPSPQRYPGGKRRPSDQSYLDDDGSPTSQRSVSGKRSPSPQRAPSAKRRLSDQSRLDDDDDDDDDDGSPTSQRIISSKRSPSPQHYPSGKSRPGEQSYVNDKGSPTYERSINDNRSHSPNGSSNDRAKAHLGREVPMTPYIIDKPHPSDTSLTKNRQSGNKQSPLSGESNKKDGKAQPSQQGHLKGGSKTSDQENNAGRARPRDHGYLSDDSQSSDQQNMNVKGYLSNRDKFNNKSNIKDQNVNNKAQPSGQSNLQGRPQIGGEQTIGNKEYSNYQDNFKSEPKLVDQHNTYNKELSSNQGNIRGGQSIDGKAQARNKVITQSSGRPNLDSKPYFSDQGHISSKLNIDDKNYSRNQGNFKDKLIVAHHNDKLNFRGNSNGGGQSDEDKAQTSNKGYPSGKSQSDQQNNNEKSSPRQPVQLPDKVNQRKINEGRMSKGQPNGSDQRIINDKSQTSNKRQSSKTPLRKDSRSFNNKADLDDEAKFSPKSQFDDDKPHMREDSKKTVQKIKDWLNHYRETAGFLPDKSGKKTEFSENSSAQAKELGSKQDFTERLVRGSSDIQEKEPLTRRRVSFSSDDDDVLDLTNDDPEVKKSLKNDVHDILGLTNADFGEDVESQLADLLADLVMRGGDEDSIREQILSILGPGVSSEDAEEIFNKLMECANEMSHSLDPDATPSFMSRPPATSTPRKQLQTEAGKKLTKEQLKNRRKAESDFKNDLVTQIKEWLLNQDILKNDADIDVVARELANDFVDRQKYLQFNPDAKTSPAEELEHMKYQVYKRLNKLLDTEQINAVMPKVPILMNSIKRIPVPQLAKLTDDDEFVQEELEQAISDWIKNSPLYKKQNEQHKAMLNKVPPELADALTSALQPFKTGKSNENPDEVYLREIVKHLEKPLPPRQISITSLQETGNDLIKHLKELHLLPDNSNRSDQMSATSPTSQLNDAIMKWCYNLPFPNTEEGNKARQDIAYKIMSKVAELNMNPQILNDDILYEDILSDFIDQQLNSIPGTITNKEALKYELMNEVNKLRQPLRHKMAGQAYKQQLRDTVPKTLPSIEKPTEEDEASFEIMKDNLADAYINLNYVGGDTALKEKFKNKIHDEIGKFANNYMDRRPNTPLSTSQLKKDLLSAMKKVEVPGDESMRSEVEQARMRDIIDDWVKELPLNKQTPVEQLHTNKVLKAMTQRLLDLEKENELNPSGDYEEKLEKEIAKYAKKLPVNEKANLDKPNKKLVEKIRATEHSRTFTEGSRRSVDIENFLSSSGVDAEDRAHLQRIRERHGKSASKSGLCRHCKTFVEQPPVEPCCKDASVSPPPKDHSSQTYMATRQSQSAQCRCSATEIPHPIPSPYSSRAQIRTMPMPCSSPRPHESTESQVHISPYIVVNEYPWDDEPNYPITDCPSQQSLHSFPQNRCSRFDSGSMSPGFPCSTPCRAKVTKLGSFHSNECNRGFSPQRRRHAVMRDSLDCRPIPSRACLFSPRKVWSRPHIYRDMSSTCIPKDTSTCGCRGQVPKCRRKPVVICQTCLDDPMKLCPKCCGAPCPHPTKFYFR